MAKKSKAHSTVKAVTGLVKAIPVYQDTLQPAAKEIGKALCTVAQTINVALAPIAGLVWGYDQIKNFLSEALSKRLSNVPVENIITPVPTVAGPILESLRFAGTVEELRELYANLLAASMNKESAAQAHPSFVDVIRQITPDEARIMNLFTKSPRYPVIDVIARGELDKKTFTRKSKIVVLNHSTLGDLAKVTLVMNTAVYLDNLCRLGLLEIDQNAVVDERYEGMIQKEELEKLREEIKTEPGMEMHLHKKNVQITNYGISFLQTCISNIRAGRNVLTQP